jgi:DNA mismatch repair ATPase MutS
VIKADTEVQLKAEGRTQIDGAVSFHFFKTAFSMKPIWRKCIVLLYGGTLRQGSSAQERHKSTAYIACHCYVSSAIAKLCPQYSSLLAEHELNRVFQEELHNFESLYKFIQRTKAMEVLLFKNTDSKQISVLWEIVPCSPLKVELNLGRTYRLHLQGQRIIETRNQHEGARKLFWFETLLI